MPENTSPNQDSLFDAAPLAGRHPDEPFAVVGRGIDANEVAKVIEEPSGSLGNMGVEGLRKVLDDDIERTAELPGFTYRIAADKEAGKGKDPKQRAPAPGTSASKKKKWEKPARKRTTLEKRHADEPPQHIRNQMGRN